MILGDSEDLHLRLERRRYTVLNTSYQFILPTTRVHDQTLKLIVYYESIKGGLNIRLIYECRCDERLKSKPEGSTRLTYTGLRGGLEHLKIETRLIDERFPSVMGECEIVTVKVFRLYLELYVKLTPW